MIKKYFLPIISIFFIKINLIASNTIIPADLIVSGNATINGTTNLRGNVFISQGVQLNGNLSINNGTFSITNGIFIRAGSTSITGGLFVSGQSNLNGPINSNSNLTIGKIISSGDISIIINGLNKFNVSSSNGDVSFSGDLKVGGKSKLVGDLSVYGLVNFSGLTSLSDTILLGDASINTSGNSLTVIGNKNSYVVINGVVNLNTGNGNNTTIGGLETKTTINGNLLASGLSSIPGTANPLNTTDYKGIVIRTTTLGSGESGTEQYKIHLVDLNDLSSVADTGFSMTSSMKYKKDISDLDISTEDFMKLRAVAFKYNEEKDYLNKQNSHFTWGLIAEELNGTVFESAIRYDKDGNPEGLDYRQIFIALLKKFIDSYKELNEEKEKVTNLKTDIEDLKNRVILTENTLKDFYRMMRMEGSKE